MITSAELLANASDIDGDALSVTGLSIATGNGTLADNGDGTWTYTPAANDDTGVTFAYSVSDGTASVAHRGAGPDTGQRRAGRERSGHPGGLRRGYHTGDHQR
ncbi:cadherin-like domain-containing protein [Nioella nitratireducens]|uniref:cadherin-like domain-containing protein n=1 Tax=Nioella nitratireducens TaxID=1287720 RepID=UPI0008FD50EE|nr:cadherin-like domain-containing protein [Nioella nitratireducens]